MQLTAQIHQPSMKVFTVGLADDKGVKVDAPEKVHIEKAAPVPPSPILIASSPSVSPSKGHRRSFKVCSAGLFTCFGLLVFALIAAITISEIAYHRQRDEAFFRLKWAELKQRMMGYDLMRAQMQQNAQQQALESSRLQAAAALPLMQQQQGDDAERPPVVDERLAFSNRLRNSDRTGQQSTTEAAPASAEQEDAPVDVRFAFLRAILDKLRERAAAAGLDGKMHVSLIEVRRPPVEFNDENNNNNNNNVEDLSPDSQAFQDGFGESHAPHPLTGHFRIGEGARPTNVDEPERLPASDFFGPRWEHPSQFLPEPVRPWNSFPRGGADGDSAFFPRPWEQPPTSEEEEDRPHMRVTHHFDREGESGAPSRVVTELFGAAGRKALDNMLMFRGAPMMQMQPDQQQPQQMQQGPMGVDSPGSSFPRWEATINDLPRPWLQNQQQQPAFPMQQQNDDAMMGQRLGADIGTHFRDQEMERPRLPFGTQELPQNDIVEVRPVNGDSKDDNKLQQLPWYVPRGFEHERPAWAEEKAANDVPMIFPHPTAGEKPLDAPPTVESTNKPSIANMKATQTDSDSSFLHEGEVAPPKFAAGSWQRTQPAPAAEAAPAIATDVEAARHRLPERDVFDDVPPRPTHDDPTGPADDDMDPSRVLFQVDEPHLAP